jgi:hydrogenase-4 component B
VSALTYVLAAIVGLAAGVTGVIAVLGVGMTWRLPALLPLGGVSLVLDPLAGVFLAMIGLAALPASLYALGDTRHTRRGRLAYLLFVGAMAVVPLAGNALTFLLAWELMSLASYVLVVHDRESREAIRAAWVYAVMTHAGVACLIIGMLLLGAWAGSFEMTAWRAAAPGLLPWPRNLVWTLLALGFAVKAGVIPLHVWLPLAHPAAPSHVSALMSGVMIKLGVYGLIRISLDWLGEGPPWWGTAILLAGAVSAMVGVLSAIVDRDLKRVLAFSSIENMGIILIGVGAGVLYHAAGLPALAVIGVTAALYHAVNHTAFKTLLFLGAGAVVHTTGTRDMEALGGLIKRMPWTAACFLSGALAAAALPPLNGFVSEWLTFQALLQNLLIERPAVNLVFALGLAALALTGGLAVACFVRAFGISFLAVPRSDASARAHETETPPRLAMAMLAVACLALGLGATAVVRVLAGVGADVVGVVGSLALGDALVLDVSGNFASLSVPVIAVALALAGLGVVAGLAVSGRGRVRPYETWSCGRMLQTARMEYTATAFANPFKRVFDFFYRPVQQIDIAAHPASRLFVQRIEYANPTRSLFDDWLYRPLLAGVNRGARVVRVVQSGSANLYLAYILLALLALLVLA